MRLVVGGADVFGDGGVVCRVVAAAVAVVAEFPRRRDDGGGVRADGFQFGERPGSLRWRSAHRRGTGLPLSGVAGRVHRACRSGVHLCLRAA